jgi:hypothetical protein
MDDYLTDFKARCTRDPAETIVDEIILKDDALHVTAANRDFLVSRLSTVFSVDRSEIRLWIVGSAKLGFSITEKRKDGRLFPRYRSFSPLSDIDAAIVSPKIFRLIWDDLSIHANGYAKTPWDSGELGDYMIYGWLRPDHFPSHVRRCDDWLDEFRNLSSNPRFARRSVRGGLFYSVSDLRRYQQRAVNECIRLEKK